MTPVEKTMPFAAWVALWVAALAAQGFAAHAAFTHWPGTDWEPVVAGVVVLVVTQLMKVPLSILRLRAMGRPPDDAILALVPLGNLGLAWQLVQAGEVSAERRARSERVWSGEMSAMQAFSHGISVVARSLPLVVVLALATAIPATLFSDWFLAMWPTLPRPGATDPYLQGAVIAAVVLGLYTAFQFLKIDSASRESWIPTVFFIPTVVLAIALVLRGNRGMEQNSGLIAAYAPMLVISSIRGGFLAGAWLALHQQDKEGKLSIANSGDALRTMFTRGPSLIGAHSAVVHAVNIGLQVVIPGIFYSVVYALVDAAAFYDPKERSLGQSQQLTTGIRRRIFKILALSLMLSTVPFLVVAFISTDVATLSGAIVNFTTLDSKIWMTWDVLEIVATAISTVAFAAVYEERRRILTQRVEPTPPASAGSSPG